LRLFLKRNAEIPDSGTLDLLANSSAWIDVSEICGTARAAVRMSVVFLPSGRGSLTPQGDTMGVVASQHGAHRVVPPAPERMGLRPGQKRATEMTATLDRWSGISVIAETEVEAQPPHILVFEDDPNLCDLYQALIDDVGFRATMCGRIFDSPDQVAILEPDLILLDLLFLGKPVGLDFLMLLKSDPRTAVIPVVIVTGARTMVDHLDPVLRLWNCAVLLKPFDLEDLMRMLVRLGQRV
jgi:CheY-like chemotaxis protein